MNKNKDTILAEGRQWSPLSWLSPGPFLDLSSSSLLSFFLFSLPKLYLHSIVAPILSNWAMFLSWPFIKS